MEKNIIKYEGGLTKTIDNAISITNKLLNVEEIDAVPVNIGFEKTDGSMSIIFPANTIIPVQKKEVFTISAKNQNFIAIHLLQGFSQKASENKSLMRFSIYDIPSPLVEIIFEIDRNGILNLSTQDKKFNIHIDERYGGLSKNEIQQLKFATEK